MSKLAGRKPAGWWETGRRVWSAGALRPILVAVDPDGVIVRLKHERQQYRVAWATIQLLAVQARVEAERERKAKAKLKS
jgi:hypothetical protein